MKLQEKLDQLKGKSSKELLDEGLISEGGEDAAGRPLYIYKLQNKIKIKTNKGDDYITEISFREPTMREVRIFSDELADLKKSELSGILKVAESCTTPKLTQQEIERLSIDDGRQFLAALQSFFT